MDLNGKAAFVTGASGDIGGAVGRVGSAVDCTAQVVAFCRSESISGQTAVVDGGMWVAMR
jgi:NAD(P)-dependent dehydrogenase (short-subunit alcohol dehydrogenase family)